MAVDQLTAKIYNKLSKANLAGAEGKVAIQFNLTGKVTGVFYVEILNGVPSVMPYEYIDHDAIVSGSLTNIEKVINGKLVPQVAVAEGKIKIEGNFDQGHAAGRADEVSIETWRGPAAQTAGLLYKRRDNNEKSAQKEEKFQCSA